VPGAEGRQGRIGVREDVEPVVDHGVEGGLGGLGGVDAATHEFGHEPTCVKRVGHTARGVTH
jgi:hypothetical protein